MKTIKSIVTIAALMIAGSVSTLSAQGTAEHQFKVAKGDTVWVKQETVRYLTGEEPSKWVYTKPHTVGQLGTKRFPEGVLLFNINSWVGENDITPVHPRELQPAPKQEEAKPEVKVIESEATVVKQEPAAPAQQPAAEPAQPATEEAQQAPATEEDNKPTVVVEQIKGDSIKSNQEVFKRPYDRFTIGVRGGASALMHHADKGKWNCGFDAVLDLQYAHYWAKDGRPVDLGIIVGLGIGYHQSSLKSNDSTYFSRPSGSYNVNYTVVAKDIKETDRQLQLEVPVLFSLITDNGLFFNFGPKIMLPVYTPYKQTVNKDETHISAYFEEMGITVIDKKVTGVYTGQEPTEKNGIQFNLNVMLTAELGYEWVLKNGNSFGLGVYADYGWNLSFKNNTNAEGLFMLTAPTETSAATLDVLSATRAYADKLSFFDAGIKLAYHFNFPKKRQYKDKKLF